jgi:hypothetical protein
MSIYKILDQEIVYDTLYYVDPTNGSADNDGQSAKKALKCPEDANAKEGTGIFLFVFVEGQHLIKPPSTGKVEYFTTNRTNTAFFVANPRKTKLTFDFADVPQPGDSYLTFTSDAYLVHPRGAGSSIYTLIGIDIVADSSGTKKNIGGISSDYGVVKIYNCRFMVYNNTLFNNGTNPSASHTMFKGNSTIAANSVFKNIGSNYIGFSSGNVNFFTGAALTKCAVLSKKGGNGGYNNMVLVFNDNLLVDSTFPSFATNNPQSSFTDNIIDSTALVDARGYLYRNGGLAEPQTVGVMQGVYNWELFDYGLDVPDIAMSTTLDVFDYSPPPEKYNETDGYSEIEGAEFAKQTRTAINVNKTDIFGLNREFLKLGWKAGDITASLEAHKADIAPHGAAAAPAGGHIPLYKEGGALAVASPIENEDAANKEYTDALVAPVSQTAAAAAAGVADLNQSLSGLNAAVVDFNSRITAAENAADNALTSAGVAAEAITGLRGSISDNTALINVRTERPGHNFGTDAPADSDLTAFALDYFYGYPPDPDLNEVEEPILEDGTAVVNLFNDHLLIYRPPAPIDDDDDDSEPPAVNGGSWEDCGLAAVKTATASALGTVKGSSEEGKASVNADGEIVLNITLETLTALTPASATDADELLSGERYIEDWGNLPTGKTAGFIKTVSDADGIHRCQVFHSADDGTCFTRVYTDGDWTGWV